jgi:hypothetical protein
VVRIGLNKKFKRAGGYYFTFLLENREVELRLDDIFDCLSELFRSLGFYFSHLLLSNLKKNPYSEHVSSFHMFTFTPNGSSLFIVTIWAVIVVGYVSSINVDTLFPVRPINFPILIAFYP